MGTLGLTFAGAPRNPAFEKMTFTTLPAGFAADDEGGTRKGQLVDVDHA